ncbi:MAG: flavin reductase ActVB [Rhodococcus sp. (in: high G+C Gram-positive bacteria)]|jgi:flavin reductase ActVB
MPASDPDRTISFKDAMAGFPSGVTVVTAVDKQGKWWGFTASSFCSLSVDPPLVLVCLSTNAECHPVFEAAEKWVVHVIHSEQVDVALRFATRGADKFAGDVFELDHRDLPRMHGAAVTLDCTAYARYEGGDHTILVGNVEQCYRGDLPPTVYTERAFHTLTRI